ncbi:NUDIX domain-containing protein [Bacillus aquiflavi]|uniref:NUDIX domain-containing protein n=1 Tax=Bacillus aquiflavi TaxID=2672567 RepID=A0A6B3VVA0_9BACI|nr:NUDIX domain-containing protein [Bacillus aquiflavi]MBA4536545.1 NUDIX domain-containing protein [Bacillus aquiflavi]NEY80912.1 NUDIX domain-containing protein [Bacillus aquiflavi]UAC49631.1 NUDIX domain-containing protein [Bacillus aquiflavi]
MNQNMNERVQKTTYDEVIKQTKCYLNYFPSEQKRILPLVHQLKKNIKIFDRKSLPGHITASGIVIKEEKMLMIYHPNIKKWLQPGGHVDEGETPLEAAKREILEETGLKTKLHPWHNQHAAPFDIDVHSIPANPNKQEPSHFHYDFRYLLQLDGGDKGHSEEDLQISWMNIESIEEPHLKTAIRKWEEQRYKMNV